MPRNFQSYTLQRLGNMVLVLVASIYTCLNFEANAARDLEDMTQPECITLQQAFGNLSNDPHLWRQTEFIETDKTQAACSIYVEDKNPRSNHLVLSPADSLVFKSKDTTKPLEECPGWKLSSKLGGKVHRDEGSRKTELMEGLHVPIEQNQAPKLQESGASPQSVATVATAETCPAAAKQAITFVSELVEGERFAKEWAKLDETSKFILSKLVLLILVGAAIWCVILQGNSPPNNAPQQSADASQDTEKSLKVIKVVLLVMLAAVARPKQVAVVFIPGCVYFKARSYMWRTPVNLQVPNGGLVQPDRPVLG